MPQRPTDFTDAMERDGDMIVKAALAVVAHNTGNDPYAEEAAAKAKETHYAAAYMANKLAATRCDSAVMDAIATLCGIWGATGYEPWRLTNALMKVVEEEMAARNA